MPTGVALRDARHRLIEAARHVLLHNGPSGLTSRAITDEAGVAKGVLHRHFADVDELLAVLVQQRIATVNGLSVELCERAGSGSVAGNLTMALFRLFDPLGMALVRLVLTRDDLRARLRDVTPQGVPTLAEALHGVVDYLEAEQRRGRILSEAVPLALAQAVIGTGHLLFTGELGGQPDQSAVHEVIATIIVGAEPGAA